MWQKTTTDSNITKEEAGTNIQINNPSRFYILFKKVENFCQQQSMLSILLVVFFICLPGIIFKWLEVSHITPYKDTLFFYINDPIRILHGQIPYRDFWELHGPGAAYFPSLVYKILGLHIDRLLLVVGMANIFSALLATALAYTIWKNKFFALCGGLLFFYNGFLSWYDPLGLHIFSIPMLLGILLLFTAISKNKLYIFLVSGLFFGAAFFFKTYLSLAALASFSILVLLRDKKISLKSFTQAFTLCSGFLLMSIVEYSYLVSKMGLFTLIKGALIDPVLHANGGGPHIYFHGVIYYIQKLQLESFSLSETPYTIYQVANSTLLYLLPFGASILLVKFLHTKKEGIQDSAEAISTGIIIWSLLTLYISTGATDTEHVSYAAAPIFLVLPFIFKISTNTTIRKIIIFCLCLALLSVPLLAAKRGMNYYRAKNSADNLILQNEKNEVVRYIQNTPATMPIFSLVPNIPFYALTNRLNPTRYDSFNDLVVRAVGQEDSRETEMCNTITKTKPLMIVRKDTPQPLPVVYACITNNHNIVFENNKFQIWK
jgi:hypothetical protein